MINNISKTIAWLEKNPDVIFNINRGIERESMRVQQNGLISKTKHNYFLGSSLMHKWITTDFSETLLELITPVISNFNELIFLLTDIHKYVINNIQEELMWPLSMPCYIKNIEDIKIAQYGTSNIGKMKTIYRKGLKNRYGSLMQSIAGVHYNFSLTSIFWKKWKIFKQEKSILNIIISNRYLNLIRNYYRFGWIVTYLFGASPAICSSFLKKQITYLPFLKGINNTLYMPYATSLRLSEIGYINKYQNNIYLNFNSLEEYIKAVKHAMNTPSNFFAKILIKNKKKKNIELNNNILQSENELYTYIRPKRKIKQNESYLESLSNKGIEYVEIRSLDVNPFSPIGISEHQILFLDLFLMWCLILEAPYMNREEFFINNENWNKIILEGRKPGKKIYFSIKKKEITVKKISKLILNDLMRIAKVLDNILKIKKYQKVCTLSLQFIDNPKLTYSAKILEKIIKAGINEIGLSLAIKYKVFLENKPFMILKEKEFYNELFHSHLKQKIIEQKDKINFYS